jgi:hypothetical protein
MYERCLNPDWVAWAKMDTDVKNAIRSQKVVQGLNREGQWNDMHGDMNLEHNFAPSHQYRIHPDTPHDDADFVECDVKVYSNGAIPEYRFDFNNCNTHFTYCQSIVGFVGIVYELNGVETLRTSIDAAFGVPKKVLFRQEESGT